MMSSRGLIAGAALTAAFLLFMGALRAHDHGDGSWINHQNLRDPVSGEHCCNLNDCREEKVEATAGGYLVETGEVIPSRRVVWRSPGGWWRCRYLGGEHTRPDQAAGKTRCLIGPPQGS